MVMKKIIYSSLWLSIKVTMLRKLKTRQGDVSNIYLTFTMCGDELTAIKKRSA